MLKIACVAETPFQLLNAVNLFRNDPEFQNDQVDLFVPADHFHNEQQILDSLSAHSVFHEIHPYKWDNFTQIDDDYLDTLQNVPRKTVNDIVGGDYHFPDADYDLIFTAAVYRLFISILFCCKKARVYCYEDGTLSYCAANWMHGLAPEPIRKLILEQFEKDPLETERIYLYNPDLFKYPWNATACALPSLGDAVRTEPDLYYDIFGKSQADYTSNKIVFLAQASEIPSEITAEITGSIKQPFICRYHPRIGSEVDYGGIPDHSESQWELICADRITEDHILISACSSAMTSPKWLFDKEPYLIFTIPIYSKKLDHHHVHTTELIIAQTRLLYNDPKKVFIAKSTEELNAILARILSDQNRQD